MRILVGVDGGPQQQAALALAAQLAEGGELVVTTVYPLTRGTLAFTDAFRRKAEEAAEAVLSSAGDDLSPVQHRTISIADVSAPRGLHHVAKEEDVDLIVIGASHRGAIGRALLGGTGERVVHGSPVPVVVAPRDYAGAGKVATVGVAYDGTPESEEALAWAQRFAETRGAQLRLLTAVALMPTPMYPGLATPPSKELLDEMREEAQRAIDRAVEGLPDALGAEGVIVDGPPVAGIIEAAAGVDLLVAGSRGYGPLGSLLMGSVSRGLMHEAPVPVVVVPRGIG